MGPRGFATRSIPASIPASNRIQAGVQACPWQGRGIGPTLWDGRLGAAPAAGRLIGLHRRTAEMITITPKAAEKVLEIAAAEELQGQGLRLRVIGGGCAGFPYDLYFDPLSYQYLDGTEIDYVEGLHGSGFKFGNPNVKSTCGCGSSFSA